MVVHAHGIHAGIYFPAAFVVQKPVNGISLIHPHKFQGHPFLKHPSLHGAMGDSSLYIPFPIPDSYDISIRIRCLQVRGGKEAVQIIYRYLYPEYGLYLPVRHKQRCGVGNHILVLGIYLEGAAPIPKPL